MEFSEKLQQLRKNRGLTQEELAEALYVSRTAVSKWESGRGFPSIDSLKEISGFFSVSIDDLLSAEALISIAQKENRTNIRSLCDFLFGAVDLMSVLMILLPLYPQAGDGYVASVSLSVYTQTSPLNRILYWTLFLSLILAGAIKLLLIRWEKHRVITFCSLALSIGAVLILSAAGETYAVTVTFLLLVIKSILLFRQNKA
jgi:transcriptional regulator with XRE-family HTH domain